MSQRFVCEPQGLEKLFSLLKGEGYGLIGPRLEGEAIGIGQISTPQDLPVGWTENQKGGHYRLVAREDRAHFGFTVGPTGWRRFLQVPREKIYGAENRQGKWQVSPQQESLKPQAFIGVRGCDWKNILIQDKVFKDGEFQDHSYSQRRQPLFVVGVDCVVAASTCFCTSFDCGPQVGEGVDLALTEVLHGDDHFFLVRAGTSQGEKILKLWQLEPATSGQQDQGTTKIEANRKKVLANPQVEMSGLKEDLYDAWNHPHWDELGKKCLACANCTLVCPTCFCSTTVDQVNLQGDQVERFRQWDSCFTADHGYIHGGGIRPDVSSRYRQWLTHKLASWQDQFQSPGCTGCGRCVVWCPVGIDLREEVSRLRESGENQ